MDLILWRHAEAENSSDEGDDLERCLTPRGERQAARMAKWLDRQLSEGTKILCSPAQRCQQTVQQLGRKYKVRDELSPQCDHTHLLALAQWPTPKKTVLIVGHQPVFGKTISEILGQSESAISVRKGSVWWIHARVKDGVCQTSLITVQNPDMV